jgi:REG-2-like HAD superfamily hydrolase
LVTFDCAETLVRVRWSLPDFILDSAQAAGLVVGPPEAQVYLRLYEERLPEFLAANRSRDPVRGDAFWVDLNRDWLEAIGEDAAWLPALKEASDRLAFGEESILFRLFDDVPACLERLRREGVRMAVISNWDFSLHKVLRMYDLHDRFETVVASLEEGVEKPDPRLFHLTLERLGVPPERALHVGDNPVDDYEGARSAGMRAVLLNRRGVSRLPDEIRSLRELPEALDWTA